LSSKAEKYEIVRSISLFSNFADSVIKKISDCMEEIFAPAGKIIFKEGDPGDALYVIADGAVSLFRSEIEILTRDNKECIGEMALIDNMPRSATIKAKTDTKLLRLGKREFDIILQEEPVLYRELLMILVDKIRQDLFLQTEVLIQKTALEQDISRAAEIQQCMLPKNDLILKKIEVTGWCRPAADISGDYFDYKELDDGRIVIVVGDVAGHGFEAGLFVAIAKSCFEIQLLTDPEPAKFMKTIDYAVMHSAVHNSLFDFYMMSCCYIIIDTDKRKITYCNAGHPAPYLCSDKKLEKLIPTNPMLGLSPMFYQEHFISKSVSYKPGDMLVIFSDGLLESKDSEGATFGYDNLENIISSHNKEELHALKETIETAFKCHCPNNFPEDDVTLVIAKLK